MLIGLPINTSDSNCRKSGTSLNLGKYNAEVFDAFGMNQQGNLSTTGMQLLLIIICSYQSTKLSSIILNMSDACILVCSTVI